jgi:tRNA (guanine-N7-)-methyltransferase
MFEASINLVKSRDIKKPHKYVTELLQGVDGLAYDEEKVRSFRGEWRQNVFGCDSATPVDLEIGTGNGFHFAHRATQHPHRKIIGIEIKFKPLVQAARRAELVSLNKNFRMVRYDANHVNHLFNPGELNHVFVHHPDPWNGRKQKKHRLMKLEFLESIYKLQQPGSFLDFKTDSLDYFEWTNHVVAKSSYEIIRWSDDLHKSEYASENFMTHFERLFSAGGKPIYYWRALRR